MLNFKYIRAGLVAAALAALTLPNDVSSNVMIGKSENLNPPACELVSVLPSPIEETSIFYSVRRDLRRCVSPLCGGYFVKRVNMSSTRCADGRFLRECYVAEIDWNGQSQRDDARMVVRGTIVARQYARFGNLGELRISESWKPLGTNEPVGIFYLVRDRGVRCIAFPCPTHSEAKLNSRFSRNIAGVNLDAAGLKDNASVAQAAMIGPDGVIALGRNVPVKGPGGRSFELRATQVYVRNKSNSSSGKPDRGSMKPCFRSGCSNQVCADHNVITTCEWRPEYECYQKAKCERQTDGNCGFTQTPELKACLLRK